uniref:Fungal lipase-like domain-containing protein n=4 Tax=Triticinae TaxID=1648030 RepID=A0A453GZI8_AEGTS
TTHQHLAPNLNFVLSSNQIGSDYYFKKLLRIFVYYSELIIIPQNLSVPSYSPGSDRHRRNIRSLCRRRRPRPARRNSPRRRMSLACGLPLLECVYCLGCARWAWKRCVHSGHHDSATWGHAAAADFAPVPRMCRLVMANYAPPDLLAAPPLLLDPSNVVRRRTYADTGGRVTPYLVYLDHAHADIVLALRGLNLGRESDYALLLDNRLGKRRFDGGYVHNGLLRAAGWVLDKECDLLRDLLDRYPAYTLTFTGHSLGAGVAAMLTMVVVLNLDKLGKVERGRTRCYAMAPARCMSLNLAVRYADVINSVVLQDDFLPRTATPLEDIFKSILCLPCLLCLRCLKDTCIPEDAMLKDPRRLYAPGRIYHIVERKSFRCGRYPPVVKTAVPVDGRFEHVVLSCNATMDHAIVWIEREGQRALDLMLEKERAMAAPSNQQMERDENAVQREHVEEHKAALRRAATLSVSGMTSIYGTFDGGPRPERSESFPPPASLRQQPRVSWNDLIEQVFDKDEDGQIVLRSPSPPS